MKHFFVLSFNGNTMGNQGQNIVSFVKYFT